MCLNASHPKVKILKEDKKVYKILEYKPKSPKYKYVSWYKGFKYSFNTLYTIKGKLTIYYGDVNEGFHAYRTKKAYKNSFAWGNNRAVLVECTIPKGSEYFLGKNGDIVSNQIILNNIIK